VLPLVVLDLGLYLAQPGHLLKLDEELWVVDCYLCLCIAEVKGEIL